MIVMEDMLKDFVLGEHLLLVGNQVSDGGEPGTHEWMLMLQKQQVWEFSFLLMKWYI